MFMGKTESKCLRGIIIPIDLPEDATYEQFAACIPGDVAMHLKKLSFLYDAGMVPICNSIIIPETMIEGFEIFSRYKICRIIKFYRTVRKGRKPSDDNALRVKGGEYYMFWRSTGYGYKLRRPRSKFPKSIEYENEEERDKKNPYISIHFPEIGKATIELYITSRRTAERKVRWKELAGIVVSRVKGTRLLEEYNNTNDSNIRSMLREKALRLGIKIA